MKNQTNNTAAVTEETLNGQTIKEITAIYNLNAKTPVKKFSDKKTAIRRTLALLEAKPAEPTTPVAKEAKISKISKLKAALRSGINSFTIDELLETSGYDEKNLRVALSVLRGQGLSTTYERKTRIVSVSVN